MLIWKQAGTGSLSIRKELKNQLNRSQSTEGKPIILTLYRDMCIVQEHQKEYRRYKKYEAEAAALKNDSRSLFVLWYKLQR